MRIAGIVSDILSETIVIIVTVRRTFHLRKNVTALASSLGGSKNPGLGQLLFKDGMLSAGLERIRRLSTFQELSTSGQSRSCSIEPRVLPLWVARF